MISHLNDMKQEVRSRMRDGNGDITLTHLFDKADMLGKSRMAAKLVLPAGASIGTHPHNEEAEMYIVLSGEATVTENGTAHVLHAGESSFTGGGATHSIENTGSEDLVIYALIFN